LKVLSEPSPLATWNGEPFHVVTSYFIEKTSDFM